MDHIDVEQLQSAAAAAYSSESRWLPYGTSSLNKIENESDWIEESSTTWNEVDVFLASLSPRLSLSLSEHTHTQSNFHAPFMAPGLSSITLLHRKSISSVWESLMVGLRKSSEVGREGEREKVKREGERLLLLHQSPIYKAIYIYIYIVFSFFFVIVASFILLWTLTSSQYKSPASSLLLVGLIGRYWRIHRRPGGRRRGRFYSSQCPLLSFSLNSSLH